jgi:UDP-3-O-[3-hydroxymyristoyl] glucosamine N-acyltransferase
LTIGKKASISLGSVVTKDVKEGNRVSGNFAIDHDRFIAFIRSIR